MATRVAARRGTRGAVAVLEGAANRSTAAAGPADRSRAAAAAALSRCGSRVAAKRDLDGATGAVEPANWRDHVHADVGSISSTAVPLHAGRRCGGGDADR